jgi:hypothetical protein
LWRLEQSWLSSESTYRLQVEKTKDAMDGEKFAEDEYEKWKVTNKKAKAAYEEALKRHEQQRKDLADERELIRMIMRYIGVLSDVKATEKSIAAGGRDSVIDPTTGSNSIDMFGILESSRIIEHHAISLALTLVNMSQTHTHTLTRTHSEGRQLHILAKKYAASPGELIDCCF